MAKKLKYPEELDPSRYVEIQIFEYDKDKLKDSFTQIKAGKAPSELAPLTQIKDITAIYLPLPNSFTESYDQSWESQSRYELTKESVQLAAGVASSVPGIGGIAEKGQNALDKTVELAENAMSQAGTTMDPLFFQVFKGTNPRNFTFDFTFIPESKSDADTIIEIYKALKKHSSATKGVGFLFPPKTFSFKFSNGIIQDLMRIDHSVITNITTNLGADGNMDTFFDGMPKQITMSISIAEKLPKLEENWND